MTFNYTVYTPHNKILKGQLDANDKELAVSTLERAGYKILSLKKSRGIKLEDALPSLYKVKRLDVALFTRQLAMLMEKGVRFLDALRLSQEQTKNRLFRSRLNSVIDDIEGGFTFSEAISRFPDIFPSMYQNMIMVGEKSGRLESVLREVANDIEQDENSRKKIRSAFIYPGVILALGVGVIVIMVTTVLPSMTTLFSTFNTELPLPTKLTLSMADFFTDYGLYVLGGILALVLAGMWYSRTKSGKYYTERFIMAAPFIGKVIFLRNLYQFSRITTILLEAGLPITDVILIAQQGVQSEAIKRELAKIPDNLMQGYGLSRSMRESRLFPSMLIQMVITGEETNSLEASFLALSEHYDFEFNQALNTLISMLEPAMISIVGLIIGFVAISAMMPMYSMYEIIY